VEEKETKLGRVYKTKTNDELLSLYNSANINNRAQTILVKELKKRDLDLPEQTESKHRKPRTLSYLKMHWEGEALLLSAYWGIGVGANCLFKALFLLFQHSVIETLILIVWVPYIIFAYVSIWQCANNAEWKIWGYIARGTVIIGSLRMVFLIS
jgi:hypothetical protein